MASQKHHWKEILPGEYLGAYSLKDQDMVVTIKSAGPEIITGTNGKKERCLVIHFHENILNMVCNKTNAKIISKVVGSSLVEDWKDKKITLYPTTTRFGGEITECIRVRETAPKQAPPIMCEKCGQQIQPAANMTAEQLADYGLKKYGKKLCIKCGKEAGTAQADEGKAGETKQ